MLAVGLLIGFLAYWLLGTAIKSSEAKELQRFYQTYYDANRIVFNHIREFIGDACVR